LNNDCKDFSLRFVRASSSQEPNDLVEGAIGFAVGGVEFRVRPTDLIGSVVKEAVGERSADALMEEHEAQSGRVPWSVS
jgi:hypothetical protein